MLDTLQAWDEALLLLLNGQPVWLAQVVGAHFQVGRMPVVVDPVQAFRPTDMAAWLDGTAASAGLRGRNGRHQRPAFQAGLCTTRPAAVHLSIS